MWTPSAKLHGSRNFNEKSVEIALKVDEIARAGGWKSSQVALAWMRQQPGVIVPIVGARRAGPA